MKKRSVSLVAVLALVALAAPAAARQVDQTDNVSVVARFAYTAGTDLDFSGNLVYAARQGDDGGVAIIDVSKGKPRQVGFVGCPGTQNDVAVVKPGLIALGFYSGQCGGGEAGIRLIDVRNPRKPRFLDTIGLPTGPTR